MNENLNFFKLLVNEKILTETRVRVLSSRYDFDSINILKHLISEGNETKDRLCNLYGDSLGISYVNLRKIIFDENTVNKLTKDFAKKYNIIFLYEMNNVVTAATFDPDNQKKINEIERITQSKISTVFSLIDDIHEAIGIQYQSNDNIMELSEKIAGFNLLKHGGGVTTEELEKVAGNKVVINLTESLMLLAIKERASDIHIEPQEQYLRIRLRIDGILHEKLKFELSLLPPISSRYKILGKLDITEKRKPQDGHISLSIGNKSFDFRFSSVPTIFGEKIVLRVLGSGIREDIPKLEDMIFSKTVYDKLKSVIDTPNGVFFVTGPTGSGKTTTLFSVLQHLNTPDKNIMTIEDPVEYRLPGTNQLQINQSIDLDFSKALRSFLRQDPDVILVGEIRDAETAKIASQAALTGHLVLASMHTNNSLQAVTRLIEIGVEPFLVAPSIIGVMAQRLVRKICENCKTKYKIDSDTVNKYFTDHNDEAVYFYKGDGCNLCQNTGYSGRLAIHELFIMNDVIRSLIAKNSSILEIQQCALKYGFTGMRYDGLKKVLRGLTTIKEVTRVTESDL